MGNSPTAKPEWIPKWLRFDKARDALCSVVLLGLVIALFGLHTKNWWCYLITFGASWGMLSTYWDELFGYDNFYAHGFGCSLATIPLFWVGVPWWILLIHAVICTVGMGLWSKLWTNDVVEECGRGVAFIL
jgi:hypothetical protein